MNKKNLILFLILIILIILGFMWTNSDSETNRQSNNSPIDIDQEVEQKDNFSIISPEDWERTESAQEAIQSLAENQIITQGIIQDPNNENIYYFASMSFDEETEENLVGIYQYQMDDYTWERLFRRSYQKGDFADLPEDILPAFYLSGYDDGIIFTVQDKNYMVDADCTHPILSANDADDALLLRMQESDPYGGFPPYEPTEEINLLLQGQVDECNV